jgi:threonine dehydrogenase-like Zn-dependent dehydrogenase
MCEDYDYLGSRSDGGFAEYCLVPSDWHFVPTENPAANGEMLAMTEPCTVAQHAIRKGGVCAGKSVRIFGAGPITFGTVVMNVSGAVPPETAKDPNKLRRQMIGFARFTAA